MYDLCSMYIPNTAQNLSRLVGVAEWLYAADGELF